MKELRSGEQVEAIGVGEFNVEQHKIRLLLGENLLDRRAAIGLSDLITILQGRPEQSAKVLFVVYD